MTSSRHRPHGILLAALGVFVLSPDALIIRLVHTDRWSLLFWRGLLLALALCLFLVLSYRRDLVARVHAIGKLGLLAGVLFALSTVLFVTSITLTNVANTLLITSAAPLFAAVLSFFALRERTPLRTVIAITIALLGIAVIFSGSLRTRTYLGDLCAVGSACSIGAALTTVRVARETDMIPAVALAGFIVAVAMVPVSMPFSISLRDFVWLVVLGVLVLPVSLAMIVRAPRYLAAAEVSLIMLLEAILGPLWVWAVFREMPGMETLVGGAMLLGTLTVYYALDLRLTKPPGRLFSGSS
jgi:drug/metabolite transporter (DMT)-like permease